MSLRVRRMLTVVLAIWTVMMAFAGFGVLMAGIVMHRYVSLLVERPSKSSSTTAATISSVLWYSYIVITLPGALMTVVYALACLVRATNSSRLI